MVSTVNLTLIIPTNKRSEVLDRTIESISKQDYQPDEIIVVDATEPFACKAKEWGKKFLNLKSKVVYIPAVIKGAAAQRNYAMSFAKNKVLGFSDDDILLEEGCIRNLWIALTGQDDCGGVNATMINQTFHELGKVSRIFYNFLNPEKFDSYAGRVFGPAIAFYPKLSDSPPDYVRVDWLNSCLVFYKKEALPNPVFDDHFTGYSLGEDLALSLKVAKNWKLFTVQTARIFHNSQPGDHKDNLKAFSEMDLVNRYYIMKHILNKNTAKDKWHLLLVQLWGGITSKKIISRDFWLGKISGIRKIRNI
jgi:glycosyltransferase involved in cell wall biosynthesis